MQETKPKGKFTQNYPSERKDYPSKEVVRGMRAAVEALRLEDFPMDKTGIDYAVGDIEIEDGHGGHVAIRDLTDHIPAREFRSAEEVAQTLRAAVKKFADEIQRNRKEAA